MAKKPKKVYKYPIDEHVVIHGRKRDVKVHITAKTREEANAKIANWARRLEADIDPHAMTVEAWADIWKEKTVQKKKITEKSRDMYDQMLRLHILPIIGKQRLSSLTQYDCQNVLDSMSSNAKSYQHKCRLTLQALISAAYYDDRIAKNVAAGIKLPNNDAANVRRVITDDERRAIETVCYKETLDDGRKNDSGAFYLLMLYCGLRPGECCALEKKDVDFSRRIITVRQAKERGNRNLKKPKTDAGIRQIPMTRDFSCWLELWMENHRTPEECPLVFAQRDRKTMISDSCMQRKWQTYKKHIDIELGAKWEYKKLNGSRKNSRVITQSVVADDLIPYDLRHTYATNLILYGVDTHTITYLMGHSDSSVTAKYYIHINKEILQAAQNHMDEYLEKHEELRMSDVAIWGQGSDAASELRLRKAYEALISIQDAQKTGQNYNREEYLSRKAEFFAEMFEHSREQNKRECKRNAKKQLSDFNEALFEAAFDAIFIKKTWPNNPYIPDYTFERYLFAMLAIPPEKVAENTSTIREREAFVRGAIDFAQII